MSLSMFVCFSTEAWKKETWEDSEWGTLPSCDQPQPVPPTRKLHRLHRLGHGSLHQEVQTVYWAVIYSCFHFYLSIKYTDSHWEQSEFHHIAHRIKHQEQCSVASCTWKIFEDKSDCSFLFFVTVSCATCWTVWVWLQRMWWREQVSSSTAVTSTVIPSDQTTGEPFLTRTQRDRCQVLTLESLWFNCLKRKTTLTKGMFLIHFPVHTYSQSYIYRCSFLFNPGIYPFLMEIVPDGSYAADIFLLTSWEDCRPCAPCTVPPLHLNRLRPALPFCYITQLPHSGQYLLPSLCCPTLCNIICDLLPFQTHALVNTYAANPSPASVVALNDYFTWSLHMH